MSRVGRVAVSAGVWAVWALMVVAWTPVVLVVFLVTAWWDRRRQAVGRSFRLLARAAVAMNPLWTVRFHGSLPEDRSRAYVAVSNHESLVDPILLGSLPWETKWIAKEAVFRIPFLGQMMRMAGDVPVRRRDPDSRAAAYAELESWIGRGASVTIFPEGTRSPDGELLPFRNGAFRLALETRAPVLPLAVVGTRRALRKGSLVFGRARADVAILDPEGVGDRGREDVDELRETVRGRIADARRRLRAGRTRVPGAKCPDGGGGAP